MRTHQQLEKEHPKWWAHKPVAKHKCRTSLLRDNEVIGYVHGNRLQLLGEVPDTILIGVVGRKLIDVVDRNDFARDIRVIGTERAIIPAPIKRKNIDLDEIGNMDDATFMANFPAVDSAGWILICSGSVLLPEKVLKARQQSGRSKPKSYTIEDARRRPKA